MNYINNWQYELSAGFNPGQLTLPLPAGAIDRLTLSPGDQYLLTLTNDGPAGDPASAEIILITGDPEGYVITRAQEGTQEATWPEGSRIYCTLTAGTMSNLSDAVTALLAQVADLTSRIEALESGGGGDLPHNVLVDSAGNTLTDSQGNYLTYGGGGGGDLPHNVLVDSAGNTLTDSQGNYLTYGE